MIENQRTLKTEARVAGVGLHTGAEVRALFRPAPADAGIRFFRADLPGCPMIPARLAFVKDTHRGTTLALNEARVHTVEHVLSACAGLGLDDLDVVLDAPEPPAADGSALPFVQAFLAAGIAEHGGSPRRTVRLSEPVRYENGKTSYTATPSERFEVFCELDQDGPIPLKQTFEFALEPETYMGQIAPARTFAFDYELEQLKAHGLAQGGSLDNAVLIAKDGVHSKDGLRFSDEFVRHKILDLIGDLTLIGRSLLRVRIEARRCGHTHNIPFAKLLDAASARARKKPVLR